MSELVHSYHYVTETVVVVEPGGQIVAVAQPGIQGPPGPPDTESLKRYNRLAEFDTPEARAAARANLELQIIDCGVF